jgi:ribonucleoside-diphosphate reductase alpha chain
MNKKIVKNKVSLFEKFTVTPYQEVRVKIDKKAGPRPEIPAGLPKGDWTSQSLQVLEERYLRKNDQGKSTETPDELCWRVSWEVASAEAQWGGGRREIIQRAGEFYISLVKHTFLPNSPTLMNAGLGNMLQYSGCFVVPVADSLVGIFDALKSQALIHQTGGGTGFSFSRLRPKGSIVKSSMGVASGPVSFMRIFDAATNEIKQGGKRRGANMGILRVDHPDILEFIHCKEEGGITNFNISVGITDKFMEAYEKDEDYDLLSPKNGEKVGSLSAKKIFNEIAQIAWQTGDPGLIFLDRINRGFSNPVPSLGPIESTNPCGEQPLYPFDSCNLGSIFLNNLVIENDGQVSIDWEGLKETTKMAVRFLDNVIEVNPYTLPEIRKTTLAIRRIGLGVGGWADLLVKLKIPYSSQEALDLAEKVMRTVEESAVAATGDLAKERGSFPLWKESIYFKKGQIRRNSSLTTIAPTGSISIIAGASSGIEPLFAIAYQHIVKDKHMNRKLSFINPDFVKLATELGVWDEKLEKQIAEKGVLGEIEGLPSQLKDIFATAHEIGLESHVKTQVAFQKYTENAVSKTINLRENATVGDVKDSYLMAWNLGAKGITIFRDGSKDAQVLNVGLKTGEDKKKNEDKNLSNGIVHNLGYEEPLLKRPGVVDGSTYRLETPVGSAFITINQDSTGMPLEVFINVGKAGSDVAAMAEALGRTISTALRFQGSLNRKERAREIALPLSGIGGSLSVGFGPNKIRSLPDAGSAAFSNHFGFKINGNGHSNGNEEIKAPSGVVGAAAVAQNPFPNGKGLGDPTVALTTPEVALKPQEPVYVPEVKAGTGDICPSCGLSSFVFQEGCGKCLSCGHSEC